jgi:hypothetical protein
VTNNKEREWFLASLKAVFAAHAEQSKLIDLIMYASDYLGDITAVACRYDEDATSMATLRSIMRIREHAIKAIVMRDTQQ